MTRLRRSALAALAVGGVGLLGACTSNPSAKAVAKDIVQSLPDLSETEQQCMLETIDSMPESELEALGEANVEATITDASSGDEDMQAFIASLSDCREAG